MGLKVAIVGLADTGRESVPWDQPEWEVWGLAWDADRYRFHRAFEIHDLTDLRGFYKGGLSAYLRQLTHCARLVVAQPLAEVPPAEVYPFDAVAQTVGDYWNSSIGYMLALAIHEGAEEISLLGVRMEGADEYAYQRPNCEYLVGFARGHGIKVHIPDASQLCKFIQVPGSNYAGRYGRS